jgi:predicted acyl esterase
VLAGPLDATIYATSSRPDVELVATVEDVSPSGRSFPISSGALLGSFRALDRRHSWFGPGGRPIAPYHFFTRASVRPVPIGRVTRYDIEIFPVVNELLKGHRLRLTLTTSDLPHLLPLPSQESQLLGGAYRIERAAGAASYLEVPLAPASVFDRR